MKVNKDNRKRAPTISFDFDGTLEYESAQVYAKLLISMGYLVSIVTTRHDEVSKLNPKMFQGNSNSDLFKVAYTLGIPYNRIHFTNGEGKYDILKKLNISIHLDDDNNEVESLNCSLYVHSVLFTRNCLDSWVSKVEYFLGYSKVNSSRFDEETINRSILKYKSGIKLSYPLKVTRVINKVNLDGVEGVLEKCLIGQRFYRNKYGISNWVKVIDKVTVYRSLSVGGKNTCLDIYVMSNIGHRYNLNEIGLI